MKAIFPGQTPVPPRSVDCFTSHVGEHRTVRGLCKFREFPGVFFQIPTMQQSPEEKTPFVYVTLATLVTLAAAGCTPCLFGYVTIGLARHNRTYFSQSERLLSETKEDVYRPMRGASRGVEQITRSGTWIFDLSHDPIWVIWLAEVRKFHQHHDRIMFWDQAKITAILQTTFSNGFFWMKIFVVWLRFHWRVFLMVQMTINQHWLR